MVTGASKGIGLAITRSLAAEGVQVVAGASTESAGLGALVESGSVEFVKVDHSTPIGAPPN